MLVALAVLAVSLSALGQGSKWGGTDAPPPPRPGGSPFGQPAATPSPAAPAAASSSCYAYRTKGGDAWQIACYPSAVACASNMADYQKRTPSIEAIGCAAQVYCFTYSAGAKSSACYLDGNACVQARNRIASRASNVGSCVANTTAGSPRSQVASSASPPPPPPPPPGASAPVTGQACSADRLLRTPEMLRPSDPKIQRCFGAIGQGCLSQVHESSPFRNFPINWQQAVPKADCSIDLRVSVGSIIHDTCCMNNPNGLYCNRNPLDNPALSAQDEVSNLACTREWRKAFYDVAENRWWFEKFGPYYESMNGDNVTQVAPQPNRHATTYGPTGVQSSPQTVAVVEYASTRRLAAPSGTKLEIGDVAFCRSGRFREEYWCDPNPVDGCSKTGGQAFAPWKRDRQAACSKKNVIDQAACSIEIASEESRFNNRIKHWGICE
ncbi:MAG TPA: hypothetical protein VEU32_20845 [Burkholderiales bacterium]|nr:hypothetical protein [Burkholderiales bacterium]